MFFSPKPNAVLFVEHNAISTFPKGKSEPLSLPDDLFKYLEIQDRQKLLDLVAEYVKKSNLRGKRVVVLLHRDTIFQKSVVLDDKSDINTITTDFEHTIPLAVEDRHAIGLKQKDRLYIFGANKAFYQLLVTALEAAGAKVQAVVPGIIFGLTAPDKLTHTKLAQIYDAGALTSAVNFLK